MRQEWQGLLTYQISGTRKKLNVAQAGDMKYDLNPPSTSLCFLAVDNATCAVLQTFIAGPVHTLLPRPGVPFPLFSK